MSGPKGLRILTADGLLIGTMTPGEAVGRVSRWLDNTASLAVNRDARDGLLDGFAAEDYLQRILWYRLDDRDVEVVRRDRMILRAKTARDFLSRKESGCRAPQRFHPASIPSRICWIGWEGFR